MDSNKILYIDDAEKGSCMTCTYGVLVPNDDKEINFAKCKFEVPIRPLFNFNLYPEGYRGYLPMKGNILSKNNLPCGGEQFEERKRG